MEREEILNLSEAKRIEIIKSPNDKYLNPKTMFYITLTLSEIKRKEITYINLYVIFSFFFGILYFY